jgi:hypothetical protein
MKLNSIYRAKVVNNKDPQKLGRVMVWIPDVMHEVSQDKGLWAMPANCSVGGRNKEEGQDNNYMGSCLVPKKGSYVFVFFECGNLNRPFYLGSLELDSSKSLPECQVGEYQDKWVIFKSHEGRCVVISDDPSDARVEITGKKRQLSGPPDGDTGSVYTIDGNQTTILFDERSGKEKILIRTHKGDFLHIDIDERKLQVKFESDITIESGTAIHLKAPSIHLNADSAINLDGGVINENCGAAQAMPPEGDRDT